MSLDIIIYAFIAVVLLARLWAVLGRRNDEDQERPNPFVAPQRPREEDASLKSGNAAAPVVVPTLFRPLKLAPASLAGGLEQIKDLDPAFDEKEFLQGARQAFATIIEDFAKGDMSNIARLLGPHVLTQFQAALDARKTSGQTLESKVTALKDVETTAARVNGTEATITVRFVSEQENILRDAAGKIIGGELGQIESITDLWSFARDTKSADPNWLLVETHA